MCASIFTISLDFFFLLIPTTPIFYPAVLHFFPPFRFSLFPPPHTPSLFFMCVCVCVCDCLSFLFAFFHSFIIFFLFQLSPRPTAPNQDPAPLEKQQKKTNKTQTQINKKRHDQVTRLLTVEQNKGHTSACVCVNLTLPLADSGPRCVLIGRRFSIDDVTVTGAGRLRLVRSFGSVLFIDSFESPLCTMVRRGVTIAELVCSFLRRRRLLLFHSTPSTCLGATPTGLFD